MVNVRYSVILKAPILEPVAIGTTGGSAPRWGAALVAGAIAVMAASPLAAQQTVGRSAGPSVSVDYGVLDSLGPAPTLPSLLRAQLPPVDSSGPRFPVVGKRRSTAPSDERVVLTPPGKKPAAHKRSRAKRRVARAVPAPRPASPRKPTSPPPSVPPPTPLAPVPAPPPVASLPPPPPVPAPPVKVPPPPRVSEPIAIPKAEPVPPPKPVAAPAPMTAPRSAPPPAAKPATPPPMKKAALSPGTARPAANASVQILFAAGSAKLDATATEAMTRVANNMKSNEAMRIQLLAYAGAAGGSSSQARRLSLSRALAVRSYLIGQGVRSTRIDVRALGNKSSDGPPDRVDLMTVRR